MSKRMRILRNAAVAVAATLVLTSCGLGTAGGYVPSGATAGPIEDVNLEGAQITVGSKNFTEQILLGKMAVILMQSAGAEVQDLTNVPGSNSARLAMLEGMIDFQWEYTGTAWISYMGETDPIIDEMEQWEAVRDVDAGNGLTWTEPSTVNNTYAMAMTREQSDAMGITKTSQLAELDPADLTFCLDAEFASRNDGFLPMLEHYSIPEVPNDNQRIMDVGSIYQATANGECNFGEVFTTDGRIPALDLVVLEDDENFFPRYNLSGVFLTESLDEYPQARELAVALAEALDNETLAALNARIDVDGEEPADVAYDYLIEEGLITES